MFATALAAPVPEGDAPLVAAAPLAGLGWGAGLPLAGWGGLRAGLPVAGLGLAAAPLAAAPVAIAAAPATASAAATPSCLARAR